MPEFRFLHLADVHLDTAFQCRDADARERLRNDAKVALARGVDMAIGGQWNAVLIAGDLFDGEYLSFSSEKFLAEQIKRLDEAGITSVYVTGNHDHAGVLQRLSDIAWPDRFHLISDPAPRSVPIYSESGDILSFVVGRGHSGPNVSTNLAEGFPIAEPGAPSIGLLHTSVMTADGLESHDKYAPCTPADLERTGYIYWALGHVHKKQSVSDSMEAWYSGNVIGRHPGETGARGGIAVTVEEGGAVRTAFVDLAPTRWETITLDDIDDVATLDQLTYRIQRAYRQLKEQDQGDHQRVLRIILKGECPYAKTLKEDGQIDRLSEILFSDLGVLDIEVKLENVTTPVEMDLYRGQPHVLSDALDLISLLRENDDELSNFELGPLAVDPEDRTIYLRGLLEGLDRELVNRMNAEGD